MKVIARSLVCNAVCWKRHGDSVHVEAATPEDLSDYFGYVPNAEKLVAGISIQGNTRSVVVPGDWIVEFGKSVLCVTDEQFNAMFMPFGKCGHCTDEEKECCDAPR